MTRTVWPILIFVFGSVINFLESCPTYITIWPSGKTSFEATLQLKWERDCDPKPNIIKILDKDPAISDTSPKMMVNIRNESATHIEIDQRVGRIIFPGGWDRRDQFTKNSTKPRSYPRGRCLDYYVASYRDNELLSVNCLKIQPNWMRLNDHIADIPLKNMFIPGTHASGAYYNITKKRSMKMEKYFNSQNYDIWSQLVFGVRFFDLTIGTQRKHKDESCSFWAVNENVYVNPLQVILHDVKTFIEASGEVVLIDFNGIGLAFNEDITSMCNKEFANFIENEIGEYVYRNVPSVDPNASYELRLNDIIKSGKHIILMYPMERLADLNTETDLFWPTWKTVSTEGRNESEILNEMRLVFSGKANISASIFHINREHKDLPTVNGRTSTTRERAITLSTKITDWLSGPWSLKANVVTADFIMSTNLIELAIAINRYKAYQIANNLVSFQIFD